LSKEYWCLRLDSSIYSSLVFDAVRCRIIVAGTKGQIACVDLRGDFAWNAQTNLPVCATPTVLYDCDLLVVPTFHSRCLGFSRVSGVLPFDVRVPQPWHAQVGGIAAHRDPYASPASTRSGRTVLCCAEHALCLASDGTEVWRFHVGAFVKASPVV